jgi:uncharacterized protein (DUF1501 family)
LAASSIDTIQRETALASPDPVPEAGWHRWLLAAAAGIAAINTISRIGTSGATALLGLIKTGSFPIALLPLVALKLLER